jgi:hypothetical protein
MNSLRTLVLTAVTLGGCSEPAYSTPRGDASAAGDQPAQAADSRADAGMSTAERGTPPGIDAGMQASGDSSVEPGADAQTTPSADAQTPSSDASEPAAPTPAQDAATPLTNVCPMGMICSASTDGLVQSTLTAYTNNVPYCADPTTLIPPTCTDDPDCDQFGFSLMAVCVYDLALFPRAYCMLRCNY